MPTGKFFYVARNCDDGKVAVDFYADRETAQLACDIEAKGGNPVANNKPQEIELDFGITGNLLTPDATADELRRKLALTAPPQPVAAPELAPETEPQRESSRPARPFARAADREIAAAAQAAAENERRMREIAEKIHSLDGKVIAFSGKMSMSRPRIKEYARQLGARVAGAVTENTDILVVGEDAGLKLERAQEMGITVITEAQWNDLALRCDNDNEKNPKAASFGM